MCLAGGGLQLLPAGNTVTTGSGRAPQDEHLYTQPTGEMTLGDELSGARCHLLGGKGSAWELVSVDVTVGGQVHLLPARCKP